jgi:uncharacterized protein
MTDAEFIVLVKQRLADRYGGRLRQMVLFGSRARGDSDAASDWDFALELDGEFHQGTERKALSALSFALLEETGRFADFHTFHADGRDPPTLLRKAMRQEGRPV